MKETRANRIHQPYVVKTLLLLLYQGFSERGNMKFLFTAL